MPRVGQVRTVCSGMKFTCPHPTIVSLASGVGFSRAETEMPTTAECLKQRPYRWVRFHGIDGGSMDRSAATGHETATVERTTDDRARVLLEINNAIVSQLDLVKVLRAISACLRREIKHDLAGLALYDEQRHEPRLHALDFPVQISHEAGPADPACWDAGQPGVFYAEYRTRTAIP